MRFWRKYILAALCLVLCLAFVLPALAQRGISVSKEAPSDRRVALVIGNAKYKSSPLRNPVNDARLMARTLKGLGFEVIEGEDLSLRSMKRLVWDFGKRLDRGGVGLFYYAGHGVQVDGLNYLIPVGARIDSEHDVELEAFDVRRVLVEMREARNRLNLIFLDACRDNPYSRSFRSASTGLAQMRAPSGTLISFATGPGEAAADGPGKHGIFTEELARNITRPGLMVESALKLTRVAVSKRTGGKQIPWDSSSLTGNFYFKPGKPRQPVQLAGGPGTTPEVKSPPPPPAPPKAPGTDDLAALKEEARRKEAWDAWQKRMDAYWKELETLDGSSLSTKKKAQAWRGALSKFAEDNPFSSEDEKLRARARARVIAWSRKTMAGVEPGENINSTHLPRLGLNVVETPRGLAKKYGIDNGSTILVANITAGGTAAKANIKKGDVILEAAQRKIKNVGEFRKIVDAARSGDGILLLLRRSAQKTLYAVIKVSDAPIGLKEKLKKADGLSSRGRYTKAANGVITDSHTGLQWYVGPDKNTSWDPAKRWVGGLTVDGGGWRMPSRSELKGISQAGARSSHPECLPPIFTTSGYNVWSGETRGSSDAWGFYFDSGEGYWGARYNAYDHRAFAVRSRR